MVKSEQRDKDWASANEEATTNLKQRSLRGGVVTVATQGLSFLVLTGSTVWLARLLTPRDFGLVAMCTAVTGLLSLFRDMGLAAATVQRKEISHDQISTLFWLNAAISLGLSLLVVALARPLAWFYREPRLTTISMVLAFALFVGGLGVQHRALLRRQMRFYALGAATVSSQLLGVSTAILVAWRGGGYWALVVSAVVTELVRLAVTTIQSGWIPGKPRRGTGAREMLIFGGNVTGSNILSYIARNVDNVLIGRVWGPLQLGLYSKAYALILFPLAQVNAPLATVAVPALSRLREDAGRFRRYFCQAIGLVNTLTMPLTVFLVVAADDLILILLGDQWLAATDLFRFLALGAIMQPLCQSMGWLYVSLARTRQMFLWSAAVCALMTAAFFIGLPFGARGVALGYATAVLGSVAPCIYFATRGTPVSWVDVFRASWRPLVAAMAAAIFGFLVSLRTEGFPPAMQLASSATLIFGSYILLLAYPLGQRARFASLWTSFWGTPSETQP